MTIFLKDFRLTILSLFLFACMFCSGTQIALCDEKEEISSVTAVALKHFPPQYMLDTDGKPTGFAIDVFEHIAKKADLRVKYLVVDDWPDAHLAIKSGKADLIPNQGITDDRRRWFAFTSPVETFPISIFVRRATKSITNEQSLSGHRVAAVETNVGVSLLQDRKDIDLEIYQHMQDTLLSLLAGHVDAVVYPEPVFMKLVIDTRVEGRIKTVGRPLKEIKRGIALRKDDTRLLNKLETAVSSFVQSTQYKRIYSKWYGTPTPFWSTKKILIMVITLALLIIFAMILWRYNTVLILNRSLKESISRRDRAERELILLATAIEQAAEMVIVTDNDGRIQYVNPAFENITGYKRLEAQGKNVKILEGPDVKDSSREDMRTTIRRGDVWSGYFSNKKKDGGSYDVEATISPVRDNSGNITGFVSVQRDVTHEIRLERQLQQAQRLEALGTLAGGIAHDFNNILSAIIGYSELAHLKLSGENQVRMDLEEILRAGNRAKDLVNQILVFSRQSEQELKPFQPRIVLKEALKLLRASLPSTIEIRSKIQSEALVMGDPSQIHQVVMNLCTNAGHAMQKKGGILEVGLESVDVEAAFTESRRDLKPGPYIKLTVSDTGQGISPDILNRIFDPFFTTKEKGEGTGMGLSVVHGIVKNHGGAVYVYSKLGKGTRFDVFLPAIEREQVQDQHEKLVLPRGTENILIVDDEHQLVGIVEEMLRSLGYEVTTRTSSIEALALFKSEPDRFDLVITDMTMPEMTGDELAGELIAFRPNTPIILCTGFSQRLTAEKAKKMGISALILKPIIMRELAETVRKALDEKKKPAGGEKN